jgi:hypothetical protein
MRVTVHRDEDGRAKPRCQEIEDATDDGTREVEAAHTRE